MGTVREFVAAASRLKSFGLAVEIPPHSEEGTHPGSICVALPAELRTDPLVGSVWQRKDCLTVIATLPFGGRKALKLARRVLPRSAIILDGQESLHGPGRFAFVPSGARIVLYGLELRRLVAQLHKRRKKASAPSRAIEQSTPAHVNTTQLENGVFGKRPRNLRRYHLARVRPSIPQHAVYSHRPTHYQTRSAPSTR